MQIFPCPFCGPRNETEFRFGGEHGNIRPEGFRSVPDAQWSAYLHDRSNVRGLADEIWVHLSCGEVFRMQRDTVNHEVSKSYALIAEASE